MKLTEALLRTPLHRTPLHEPAHHESGSRHSSGRALYVDDLPVPAGTLFGWVVTSPAAHGAIVARDASAALAMPGVHSVLFAENIPGHNQIGPIVHDEPVFADRRVDYAGQPVALVLAHSVEEARDAAALVRVSVAPEPAILSIQQAIALESFHTKPHVIARGDVEQTLKAAHLFLEGEVSTGGQDHFYLETQASFAFPEENGCFRISSSTQHPTEIQKMVAEVLGIGQHRVVCEVPRMGGGFGGKESQATAYACMAALGAYVTGRPVKVWLNRDEDMRQTGKRHPFFSRFRAGFSEDGELLALDVNIFSDGGFSLDLSPAVMDRALFHLDGAYHISNVRFCGRVCKTHLPSNTAFRGFGGPQGVFVVEEAINRAAERLGIDPTTLRLRNLYGPAPRNTTHFGQEVRHNRLPRIAGELLESSEYQRRAEEIARINAQNKWVKRGIGLQLVKFGISFTNAILNQAGALLHIYADGTVQLNHGGTEMGQGLHTKMLTVCAHELGVPVESVRAMPTSTEKVPNTSATAASAGSDLNGQAVRGACDTLKQRMAPVACDLLGVSAERAPMLTFAGGAVTDPERPERSITFSELAKTCWLRRVSLSATGYYSTPGIQYDPVAGRGTPFFYFAFGGAVVEVEVHGLTGEHRVIRADILHDVGDSLVPSIDKGQVEGAFVQGLGWLTCEEVLFRADGTAVTTGPSTYKIPAFGDPPLDFRVALLEQASQPEVIHGSKAVGEPPFLLAIGAITALRRAIGAFGPPRQEVDLALPATPEAILRAVERARGH